MKFIASVVMFILFSPNLSSQWIQTSGPAGNGIIRSFAKTDNNVIFGGSYSFGVYKSSDNGVNWVQTSMKDKNVHQLSVSGSNVYAGTSDGGYYTSDMGAVWHKITDLSVGQFLVSGSKLYAGTYDGVYTSTDNGSTWTASGLQGRSVYSLINHGSLIVAGLRNSYHMAAGIYVSTDAGLSWIKKVDSTLSISYLASHNNRIYAISDGTLLSSSDNGNSWNYFTYPENLICSIAFNDNYVFAATRNLVPYYPLNKILRSSDGGTNWEIASQGKMFHFGTEAMITAGSTLIASCEQISQTDIYRSPDNGVTWSYGNSGIEYKLIINMTAIGSDLYCGTYSGEVYKTTDDGFSWIEINPGFFNEKEMSVWSLIAAGNVLIAGLGSDGLYRSVNGGADWQYCGLTGNQFERLLYDGTNVFAGSDKGLYLSTDQGASWTLIGFQDKIIYTLAKAEQTLYASVIGDGVQRTDNLGASWTRVTDIQPQMDIGALAAIGSVIYAGTPGYGVFRSTDQGTSWSALNDGLPGSGVIYINELYSYGGYLFAGVNGSMYQTVPEIMYVLPPGGNGWLDKNGGLIPEVTGITDFYVLNGYLFAGTHVMSGQGSYGRSVWRAGFNEITSIGEEKTGTPVEFALLQNYPNPFNPATRLSFTLPEDSKVKLRIFNGLGEEVREPVNSEFPSGSHQIDFDAAGLPSGVYFCRMEAAGVNTSGRGKIATIRMILLK